MNKRLVLPRSLLYVCSNRWDICLMCTLALYVAIIAISRSRFSSRSEETHARGSVNEEDYA